ncbi:MAG: dockerin type I repeat-containing protein [Planctomycetota bacterium]
MSRSIGTIAFCIVVSASQDPVARLLAQGGPFDPEEWPPTIDESKMVHFVSVDSAFDPPAETWTPVLSVLTGGDQVTEPITIGGHDGLKETGQYLNVRDPEYAAWADVPTIDILVQVYGDEAVLGAGGNPRDFVFLTGILPELAFPAGGSIPAECKNRRWNWFLFRIPNGIRPSDGQRLVGTIPANAQGDYSAGGVNGGTIRFENVPGLKIRLVAFGEEGAFGAPEDTNVCAPAEECPPEPETNHVWVDIAAGTSHYLEVLDGGDQAVTFEDGIGPPGDARRAVRPNGLYMNFGIQENYLGVPCNDPRAMKICVTYYDDPALAGARFGPEAYATDDQGGVAFFPSQNWQVLGAGGNWVQRSWVVPAVSLAGVNAAPLTGGPRLAFENGAPIAISRVDMAILRKGDHPLAGQDPIADCYADPLICTDAYGNYAELDLGAGVQNGLAPGTSGGDQEMVTAEAGPAGDRRLAVRPAFEDGTPGFAHNFLNFAIVGEPFGPSSQPNARLAICVTYYDDPELAGASFRPEVYQTEREGTVTFGFTDPSIAVALEGTDEWREAYFEIPDVKFLGVNQGPQAAARFVLSGKIFFTRVRYAVIRPCGPWEGVNWLDDCGKEGPSGTPFVRGDANADGGINITDGIYVLNFLFLGGPEPPCGEASDTNGDGGVNITDGIYVLNFLFLGGPEPPAPYPDCGDLGPEVNCASFPPCAP